MFPCSCIWLGIMISFDLSLRVEAGNLLSLRGGGRGLSGAIRKSQRVTGKSHNLGCLTTLPSGYDKINQSRLKYYNDHFAVVREKVAEEGVKKRKPRSSIPGKLHLMRPAKAKKLQIIHRRNMREMGVPLWSNPQREKYLKFLRERKLKGTR